MKFVQKWIFEIPIFSYIFLYFPILKNSKFTKYQNSKLKQFREFNRKLRFKQLFVHSIVAHSAVHPAHSAIAHPVTAIATHSHPAKAAHAHPSITKGTSRLGAQAIRRKDRNAFTLVSLAEWSKAVRSGRISSERGFESHS